MRANCATLVGLVAAGLALSVAAWAQNGPIQSTELPPLQEQARPGGYPTVQPSPVSPGVQGQGGRGQSLLGGQGASGQSVLGGPSVPGQSVLGGPSVPGQGVLGGPSVPGQSVLGGPGVSGQGVLGGPGVPGQSMSGQGFPSQGAPVQGVPAQGMPGPSGQDQGQSPRTTPSVTAPATFDRPNVWVPAGMVKLQALDKVNAQATELTIKVGQAATFGSLTIAVKSCVVRPPDQPADAAAYLNVTDSHPDSPGFDGWMLQDEPSVSMMQHPIYDLRVAGCT